MTWTHAQPGAMMTKDINGTPKARPTLWLPKDRRLFIPDTDQDHARPFVLLQSDDPEQTFSLILHQTQILGEFRGKRKVLVEW